MSEQEIHHVAVELIDPNPFQPPSRLVEDKEHIRLLRESLRANGLLQIPKARKSSETPARIQLAFGHSRLAAWRAEFPRKPFPVRIEPLTDKQMADQAAEENERRKNFSAIEKAEAICLRMTSFKESQLEAGKHFGLATQAAVSHLLSLRNLPKEIQELVHRGELPEAQARALLIWIHVEEAHKDVIALARKLAAETDARERANKLDRGTRDLLIKYAMPFRYTDFPRKWPKEAILLAPKAGTTVRLAACIGCDFYYKRGYAEQCLRPKCRRAKQDYWLALKKKKAPKKSAAAIKKAGAEKKKADAKYEQIKREQAKAEARIQENQKAANSMITAAAPHLQKIVPPALFPFFVSAYSDWSLQGYRAAKTNRERGLIIAKAMLGDCVDHSRFAAPPAKTRTRIETLCRGAGVKLPAAWWPDGKGKSLPVPAAKKGGRKNRK